MGKEKLIFAAILILAIVLRLWGIDQRFWSGRPGDFHPPLFYLLAHFWLQLGRSEVWLRLLPIGFGVLAVWMMYDLAETILPGKEIKIVNWKSLGPARDGELVEPLKIGHVASFLLAVNPFHIYYSQEFRMYSLLALLGILTMYLFIKSSRWLWASLALMLYTHYASVLLFPAVVVYVWVWDRSRLGYVFRQILLAAVAYLPWWPQFLRQLNSGVNIDQYFPGWRDLLAVGPVRAVPLVLFKLVAGRIDFLSRVVYAVYLAYVLAIVGISSVVAKVKRALLLSWLLLPILVSIGVSFVIPLTQPFRLIFILPALILLLTQGVMRFPRAGLLLLVYIGVTGIVMYSTRPRLQREQWRQAVDYLESQPASVLVVKFSDRFAPLAWYAPDLPVVGAVPSYPAKAAEVDERLGQLKVASTVYLFDYLGELTDPYRTVDKSLEERGWEYQDTFNFEGVGFIHQYSRI